MVKNISCFNCDFQKNGDCKNPLSPVNKKNRPSVMMGKIYVVDLENSHKWECHSLKSSHKFFKVKKVKKKSFNEQIEIWKRGKKYENDY